MSPLSPHRFDPARAGDILATAPWPAPLLSALAILRKAGGQAYIVGGAVRDTLLGVRPAGAFDVATDLRPEHVETLFREVRPIGFVHGTVLILDGGVPIECTTFRSEGPYLDARRPSTVAFGTDPIQDLMRRDLTVNAIAYDPASRKLLDPTGGLQDLAGGTLRAVGDPAARFREDALRPLRVARFAATLEMAPEPATRAQLSAAAEVMDAVSPERVRDELLRMLTARRPSTGLELMRESKMLERWLPELAACIGVTQNRYHAHDVYRHSLLACDQAPADSVRVRWAALLHDIGKPQTRAGDEGAATFHGHEQVGAALADRRLEALRFATAEREAIVHLIRVHMVAYTSSWSDAAVRRWVRRVGVAAIDDVFALRAADASAHGVAHTDQDLWREMRGRVSACLAAKTALEIRDLAIDGTDVMRVLGVGPGPHVGSVLNELLEDVLDEPELNVRETLLARVRTRAGEGAPGA